MKSVWKILFGNMSMTFKIIILNVVIFILTTVLFSIKPEFIDYFALKPSLIVQGQNLWTLFTSVFIHANFLHLFFNMFSLYFIGTFVERIVGRKRFIWFYLISGVFAGLFFALLSGFFGFGLLERVFGSPSISGVGASGAIFGLVGLITVLTPFNKVYLIVGPLIAIVLESILETVFPASPILTVLSFLVTVYILISIFFIFSFNSRLRKISLPVEMPFWVLPIVAIIPLVIIGLYVALPIGNMAHLGGFIAGAIYGAYLRVKYKKKVKLLNRYFGQNE